MRDIMQKKSNLRRRRVVDRRFSKRAVGGESTAEEFPANGLPRADESRKASSNRRGALPLPWRRVYSVRDKEEVFLYFHSGGTADMFVRPEYREILGIFYFCKGEKIMFVLSGRWRDLNLNRNHIIKTKI